MRKFDDFWPAFWPAALLHLFAVLLKVELLKWDCEGGDCGDILYLDMPISLFYFSFPNGAIIPISLIFGTILWGVYGWLALRGLKLLLPRWR